MSALGLDRWVGERTGLAAPLTRGALQAWQAARLAEIVAFARAESPFYRARRDWPEGEIVHIEDIARFPFTCAADLVRNDPPLLAQSQSLVARVVTLETSGTSGPAKRLHFNAEDIEATLDFFQAGMALLARPGDRVAVAFPAGRPGGVADALSVALGRLGAEPRIAPAPLDPFALAAWLAAERPEVVAGPPVPLLAAARLAACGAAPPFSARAVLMSSDFVAHSLERAVASAWGAEIFRHWGMTEIGFGGAVDCACHCGCHIRENALFVEVVDPESGAPAPAGAVGEIVVTTLGRRAVPLVRYRTGDLARLAREPCACGSVLSRLDGFAGRLGEGAPLPGGARLTLPALDEALFAVDAVSDFCAAIDEGPPASLKLTIAAPAPMRRASALAEIGERLAASPVASAALRSGGLSVEAEFADAVLFPRPGKRRLLRRESARCASRC